MDVGAPMGSLMRTVVQLPLRFDAAGMRRDLAQLPEAAWQPHFNKGCYEGDWSGIALRAAHEGPRSLYPNPAADALYADTPLMAQCKRIRSAVAAFRCDLLSVRLLRLASGSVIREHRDYRLSASDGEVRLHVPIVTTPEVEFIIDGQRLFMPEGTCWYCDFSLPHSITNRSPIDRIHLVLDCRVNDWLLDMLSAMATT